MSEEFWTDLEKYELKGDFFMKRILKNNLVSGVILFALILTSLSVGFVPQNIKVAQAAKIKLSATKLSLTVGDTTTLKVTGAKKKAKIKWSTTNKSVVTVTTKGKVTAKAAGNAKIKVKVTGASKANLTCNVEVVAPISESAFGDVADYIEQNGKLDNDGDPYINYDNGSIYNDVYYWGDEGDKKIEAVTGYYITMDGDKYYTAVSVQFFDDKSANVFWSLYEGESNEPCVKFRATINDLTSFEDVSQLVFNPTSDFEDEDIADYGDIPGDTVAQTLREFDSFLNSELDLSLSDLGMESYNV